MKKFKKLALNKAGFSHLEILLLVIVAIIIAGTGYLIYSQHKHTTTSKATSYRYGPSNGDYFYACRTQTASSNTITVYQTHSLTTSELWYVADATGPGPGWQWTASAYPGLTITHRVYVFPAYISFSLGNTHWWGYVRYGNLPVC